MTASWAGLTAGDLGPALDERLALADGELDAAVAAAGDAAPVLRPPRPGGAPRDRRLRAVRDPVDGPPRRRCARGGAGGDRSATRRGAAARSRGTTCSACWPRSTSPPWRRRTLATSRCGDRASGSTAPTSTTPVARSSSGCQGRASELAIAVVGGVHRRPAVSRALARRGARRARRRCDRPVRARRTGHRPRARSTTRRATPSSPMSATAALRERFWRTFQDRGLATSLEPMRELFDTRREIAQLSGFESWAALRTATSSVRLGRGRRGDPRRHGRPIPVGRRGVHRGVRGRPRGPARRRRLPAVGPVRRDRRPHAVDRRGSRGGAAVPDRRRRHRRACSALPARCSGSGSRSDRAGWAGTRTCGRSR